MSVYDEFVEVTQQERAHVAPRPDPFDTHFVDDLTGRSRVLRAICGEPVHISEVNRRVDLREPTCPTCARLRREDDADECEF